MKYAKMLYQAAGWALVVAVLVAGGCKLVRAGTATEATDRP